MTAMERIEALERKVAELERQLALTPQWQDLPIHNSGYSMPRIVPMGGQHAIPSRGGLDAQDIKIWGTEVLTGEIKIGGTD